MNYPFYFDAGLGAMIAQAAIAALAGFVLFYKTVIAVIKGWLGMRKEKKNGSFDSSYEKDPENN
ncbi:hypothetical protein A9Q93_09075 [Nonlabens dokdonensis]|jgi:hypothetical protein|uniref:Uncharacterized protein n=1 Tax=Nonlabens dokdonensis TaxID=328515 RepID=A0A1Z8ATI4_9FLAO|nr:hypothetical protein [Nonlabens dokdonensis]OUS13657.1 hypothetical protein A9Q93_09075 [Nonlabens dokdonensis]